MDGLLRPIEDLIAFVLTQIYSVIPSVGFAIIIVTCCVMLLVFPLTHKQTKSMLAMQALQPKMKELQAEYKDDRQKLSEETMKLYKEAGVNPLGGCLPLLIQMPFFFAIFRVVSNIPKYIDPDTQLFSDLCAPTTTYELCTANAGTLKAAGVPSTDYEALAASLPKSETFFGLQLDKSLWRLLQEGNVATLTILSYIVLIVLIATASYISISRSQALNPNASGQMKFLKYVMPFVVSVSPIILPAGANLYILTSSTWRAIQQEFLYRKIIIPHHEKANANKGDSDVKSVDKAGDSEGPIENYQPGLARKKRKKK